MKATEQITTLAGKTARFGGFAIGIQMLIDAVSTPVTLWGKIVAGTLICGLCLFWSYLHDEKITSDDTPA